MRKFWQLLKPKERRSLIVVFFVLLGMAGVELLGIASIATFVALVTDTSNSVQDTTLVRWLKALHPTDDRRDFLLFAGIALFGIIVLRNVYVAFSAWLRLRLLHTLRRNLSARLMASYMSEPYLFFTRSNSATLTKNITHEVNNLTTGNLFSWLMIISDGVVGTAIAVMLVWSSPTAALVSVSALGAICGVVLVMMRRYMQRLGATHRYWNGEVFKLTGEAIGGIKEVKVLNRENYFVDQLHRAADGLARAAIKHGLLTELPRAILEIAVFASILAIAMLSFGDGGIAQAAGVLALFVAALYRLMPIATRIVSSINGLYFNHAILESLVSSLSRGSERTSDHDTSPETLPFQHSIELQNITFRYPESDSETIRDVSLKIDKNSSVAFVGPSGVGKSTLIDLILGLVEPISGKILIDGTELGAHNRRGWSANIGFVPQDIFLTDGTIRENIAIGLSPEEIDEERLVRAANAAHLTQFVSQLDEGFDFVVGERGARISGGQRQRIGIARALYHDAKVLVLDEATSALDGKTEAVVQDAIGELKGQITIIIIAHRLQTVERCDAIHVMEGGRIVEAGTHSELMKTSSTFKAMARQST